MKPATHKHCKDCGANVPLENFYQHMHRNSLRYSQYCKAHQQERNKRSRAIRAKNVATRFTKKPKIKVREKRVVHPSHRWPLNGSWPLLQPCGQKAQCKECKNIWSLSRFYQTGTPREDGTRRPVHICVYCVSKLNQKYQMIKKHAQREQAREVA